MVDDDDEVLLLRGCSWRVLRTPKRAATELGVSDSTVRCGNVRPSSGDEEKEAPHPETSGTDACIPTGMVKLTDANDDDDVLVVSLVVSLAFAAVMAVV